MNKLKSRKFWLCLGAFLFSVGTGIAGIITDNGHLQLAGTICCVISSGCYAVAEAMVDTAKVSASTSTNTTIVKKDIPYYTSVDSKE